MQVIPVGDVELALVVITTIAMMAATTTSTRATITMISVFDRQGGFALVESNLR